jgi:transcriptional regulator with XRE-family HTH domain
MALMLACGTVSPDDLKQLRKDLKITARDLAAALGIEQKEVVAWEAGEHFPTKRYVEAMHKLKAQGAAAFPRTPKAKPGAKTGPQRLADPKLWEVVRKLIEHPALFDQVAELATRYSDPAAAGPDKVAEKNEA